MEKRKMLSDYFNMEKIYILNTDDEFLIRINNTIYPYQMSISANVPDSECCRVDIDGEYYYFDNTDINYY